MNINSNNQNKIDDCFSKIDEIIKLLDICDTGVYKDNISIDGDYVIKINEKNETEYNTYNIAKDVEEY